MSEDQAPYLEKPDPPYVIPSEIEGMASIQMGAEGKVYINDIAFSVDEIQALIAAQAGTLKNTDPFGAKAVFNGAYDLAIASGTHPIQAVKAAYAAALAYAESYEYINMGFKDSDIPEYRMVSKREKGGGPVR